MKILHHPLLNTLLLCLICFATSNLIAGEPIYKSDFSSGKDGWEGRPGFGKGKPEVTVEPDPENPKITVLQVVADGEIGSGFAFKCPDSLKVGKDYTLTFWIRSAGSTSIGARISTYDFKEFGEDVQNWFVATKGGLDEWKEVTRIFAPTTPDIGIEIGAELAAYEPCKVLIKDVTITAE